MSQRRTSRRLELATALCGVREAGTEAAGYCRGRQMCDNASMTNNDVLRRIRYAFNYNDSKMMDLFRLGGLEASRAEISDWLKSDDDPEVQECVDRVLAQFLNGLIINNRGRREGPLPEPERRLNNNAVLAKLKIALSLRAEDLVEILALAGYAISKHELSAFFRRPDNRHYRECKDQILRRFLRGVEAKYRGDPKELSPSEPESDSDGPDAPEER